MGIYEQPQGGGSLPIIDLGAATSDQVLQPGQKGVINFTSATSIPLHVACGDGQQYKLLLAIERAASNTSQVWALWPNNTSYTGKFEDRVIYSAGSSPSASTSAANNVPIIMLGKMASGPIEVVCQTSTKAKGVLSYITSFTSGVAYYAGVRGTYWNDTTTAWTSLGTIQQYAGAFSVAQTGQIVIERII